MKATSLQEVFVDEIRDLLDAEKQLVKALPKMAKSAEDAELEEALREHLEQTKGQVQRLERVFEILDTKARAKPCVGMKGLVQEGEEHVSEHKEEGMADPVIVGAARRVEHYEMAAYEVARAMAQELGLRDAAQLLQQTLEEEMQADRKLSQIGKRLLREASRAGTGQEEEEGTRARKTRVITDHEEIRRWAEERGARPARVKGTGGPGDPGMIRLDFPGYTGEETLEPISWDEWFRKFDESNLALLYQEKTASGRKSNFNKLVSRDAVEAQGARSKPKSRTAR